MEKVTVEELLTKDISGKVICFPTDTVYGVGAKVGDLQAIEKIYNMKKRDGNKPLAILTPTVDIFPYVNRVSEEAKLLMKQQWPGALTLIFTKSDKIDSRITQGFNTVAFRMPKSQVALEILNKFGLMATTSVNISGEAELNTIEEIEAVFKNEIDYLVTNNEVLSKRPSRVIDVTGDEIKVIR